MRLTLSLRCVASIFLITLLLSSSRPQAVENPVRVEPEILKLLLKETPKPNYGVPVPEQIAGHVVSRTDGSTSGIAGVSVTDGYSVVKTDASGNYSLKPHASAVFVYITRPAGHDVQGNWYKPLAEKVNFELKPSDGDEKDYIFVHVTDTHISSNRRSLAGLSQFVREMNDLTPKPRFVVNSGDLLNLHKALVNSPESGHTSFRNYVGIMNHLTMPYYNVAGDHTDSSYRLKQFPRGDHRCAKPMFWEYLGPHFFSFEYGKVHFMSIDYGYHLGQRKIMVNGKSLDYPTLEVQPVHTKWMNQDMSLRSRGTFVVTSSEHDLSKHCPGFLKMAKQHDVRLQLVGDHHVVSYKSRAVPYRTGGALAGCWWNPKAQQFCPDLSPQGYLIYRVTGEKMDYFYKGLGQRVAIVSHRLGAPWTGRIEVQAHLVQPQPNESLEYSLDGTSWKPMIKIGQPFYRTLFAATIDSNSLPDGHFKFSVRSTATDEVRSRAFVAVNGATPPVVKADANLSFAVAAANPNSTTPRAPAGKADVLFNGKVIGVLEPNVRKSYSFKIKSANLGVANTLSFRFAQPGDGMSLNNPILKIQGKTIRDPRDAALRQIKTAHWGSSAADWGGFIVGDTEPPDESPFQRKQNRFCFVLSD